MRLATFTGREDLLRRIEQALNTPRHRDDRGPTVAITALRGLGGIGKTQLTTWDRGWGRPCGVSRARVPR